MTEAAEVDAGPVLAHLAPTSLANAPTSTAFADGAAFVADSAVERFHVAIARGWPGQGSPQLGLPGVTATPIHIHAAELGYT